MACQKYPRRGIACDLRHGLPQLPRRQFSCSWPLQIMSCSLPMRVSKVDHIVRPQWGTWMIMAIFEEKPTRINLPPEEKVAERQYSPTARIIFGI